jgi:acetyltransferase-like isoleucine patch superfamily enzyme
MRGRNLIAGLAAVLPFQSLRRWLYGAVPGYEISPSARIGWLAVCSVDRLNMAADSSIGRGTVLRGPMTVVLDERAGLGARCRVDCGAWVDEEEDPGSPYLRTFRMGPDAMTTGGHYFDAVGGIDIGEGSWIAGLGTQVWTHGLGVTDRRVVIGRYCYVGSAARFAPGARLGDLTVVGMGSVVTGDHSRIPEQLLAGVPARTVRAPYRTTRWGALNVALAAGLISYSESAAGASAQADDLARHDRSAGA